MLSIILYKSLCYDHQIFQVIAERTEARNQKQLIRRTFRFLSQIANIYEQRRNKTRMEHVYPRRGRPRHNPYGCLCAVVNEKHNAEAE